MDEKSADDNSAVENELAHKQKLLGLYRRNLKYLQTQAEQQQPKLPARLIRDIAAERKKIAELERAIIVIKVTQNTSDKWYALLVDCNDQWRDIIEINLDKLGGEIVRGSINHANESDGLVERCKLAIIVLPSGIEQEPNTIQWIEAITRWGQSLPIILFSGVGDVEIVARVNQMLTQNQPPTNVTTITKDTFDPDWFIRLVKNALFAK